MAKKYEQIDVSGIEAILNRILDLSVAPVARCRLLSSGFAPFHMLDVGAELQGTRACLGCGNCIDACGLLAREPARLESTAQRTSLALEHMVGDDCDRCENCVFACPQVDTSIKHYIARTRVVEQMQKLLAKASPDEEYYFDCFLEEVEDNDD
jgi:ferredoxin